MNRDRSSNDAAATRERVTGLQSEDQGGSPVLQFIVVGLVLGSIYALAASGLVITYVSTGVLNFAFGALAFFIARTYYYLHIETGVGHPLSAGVVPLRARAVAWGCSSIWRSSGSCGLSSQLIKVVVTIGLSVVIPALAAMIFGNDEIFQAPGLAPQPVSVYHVFGTAVTLDQVIAYVCVLAIVGLGALILRFTEAGPQRAGDGRLRGDDVAVGEQPLAHRRGRVGGLHLPRRARRASSPRRSSASTRASSRCSSRPRSPRSSPPGCAACPSRSIVGLLMGIAGSLVQYYLPPDSESPPTSSRASRSRSSSSR